MLKLEEFFSLLSDETRLGCLLLIQLKGECCVCDLACALQKIQPKISRHLAILKGAGAISSRRNGTWIYYFLSPNLPIWASRLLSAIAKEASELHLDLISLDNRVRAPICCKETLKMKEIDEKNSPQDILTGVYSKTALTE